MLVALVVIIVAVSAWFVGRVNAEAQGISVRTSNSGIDIAPCVKTYNSDYTEVLTDGPGEFKNGLSFPDDLTDEQKNFLGGKLSLSKDCTGDGMDLIVPDFNVTNDYERVRETTGKEVNPNIIGNEAVSQEQARIKKLQNPEKDTVEYQYLQFEFYVRSKESKLYLRADSQLLAETESNGSIFTEITDKNNPKKSAYGNFNVDGLVGAMRVSFVAEACNAVEQNWIPENDTSRLDYTNTVRSPSVRQLLWVPRPDVKLNIPAEKGNITDWYLSEATSGETYQNTYYKNKEDKSGLQLISNSTDSKAVVSPYVETGHPSLGDNINISDFSSLQDFERETVTLPIKNDNNFKDTYAYFCDAGRSCVGEHRHNGIVCGYYLYGGRLPFCRDGRRQGAVGRLQRRQRGLGFAGIGERKSRCRRAHRLL